MATKRLTKITPEPVIDEQEVIHAASLIGEFLARLGISIARESMAGQVKQHVTKRGYSTKEACGYLSCGVTKFRTYVRRGWITPRLWHGGNPRYLQEDLDKLIEQHLSQQQEDDSDGDDQ